MKHQGRRLEDGESINIVVGKDGVMTVKPVGIKGNACTIVTKPFENLGAVLGDTPTPEMTEREDEVSVARNRYSR